MQKPILKLKEIIWEITGKCNNGCTYCGSKDQWKDIIDENNIKKITDKITQYPPEEIDISGGDPLLVSFETHEYITDKLKGAGVKCKILVNPKSFLSGHGSNNEEFAILNLYDWIGLSVNTEEELESVKDSLWGLNKVTIISNFNITNLYMFEHIKEFVKQYNLTWQIQLTMTNKQNEAIYKSELAFKTLSVYINAAYNEGINIIPADNLNAGVCGAGTASIGILANGDVVPCLSMRSWHQDINDVVVGNVLKEVDGNSLRFIWREKFVDQRFGEFHCCKDECGNKCISFSDLASNTGTIDLNKLRPDIDLTKIQPRTWGTSVYSVTMPGNTMLYGVIGDHRSGDIF